MFESEMSAERNAGSDPRRSRANPLFSSVVRLVPCSGVQFLDLTISTRALAGTSSKYVRDDDPELGALLIELPEGARGDGFELHPVSRRPLGPGDTLWLTGYQGIEPFLGTWIPIPYLRFLGRKEAGQGRFDKGPSNWARLYIEPPEAGVRNVEQLKAVLAFDTEVDNRSRVEQDQYLAPNTDDVFFGPVFMLASEPGDLAGFLGELWLDDWVSATFQQFHATTGRQRPEYVAGSSFDLEHVARYLTLLKVLDAHAQLPEVRFVNTTAGHWQGRTYGIDLVIDIDEAETAAVIVDRRTSAAAGRKPGMETLRLRDLAHPTTIHDGPFSTVAEFETPLFGDPIASRRSGRPDAFYWPSLVRIGSEGQRLAQRASATPGITGVGGLMRGLNESAARSDVWRFSRADAEGNAPGAMVSGELMSHLTEDGNVIDADNAARVPAIRPRFSRSSMLSMFVAECLLHALSQINAPAALAASGEIREVHRIVVTCPLSSSSEERQQLVERIEDAVALVWRARGWGGEGTVLSPERPQVSLGLDSGLSAQLVYLYDEIKLRFGGDARRFMSLTRGPSRALPARHLGEGDSVRIASLDIAGGATSLAMIGYGPDSDGGLHAEPLLADRTAVAGSSIADCILRAEILPAIVRALTASGCRAADDIVARCTAASPSGAALADPQFASRVLAKVLLPAASAFLDIYQGLPPGAQSAGAGRLMLADLVRQGRGRLSPLDAEIEAMAAAHGARGFRLGEVGVRLRPRAVAATLEHHLDPLLARVAEVVRELGADLLLLSGRHARLPDINRIMLKHLPIGPHRIIDVGERWNMVSDDLVGELPGARDMRMLPLIGAALAGNRSGFAGDGFGALAEQLTHALPISGGRLPQPDTESLAAVRLARLGHNAPLRLAKPEAGDSLASLNLRGETGGAA